MLKTYFPRHPWSRKAIMTALIITAILFTATAVLFASPQAYAAQAPTSNVSGSLNVWNMNVDWFMVDWDFSFTINSGDVGDVVIIDTNDVCLIAPRDVTISSGEKIGVLELVSQSRSYPNSWNERRTYQIRLTKNINSASVTLQGSTSEGYNRFIYGGGHDETCWIAVNGVTAASGNAHLITCDWGQTDYYALVVSGLPWAVYENGYIAKYGFAGLAHSSDHGPQLAVGDTVVWHLYDNFLTLSLANGHVPGDEITGGLGYNPSEVPSTITRLEPYGFLETRNWVPWKFKILYCNANECAIQITQVGTGGIEWDVAQSFSVTLSPQNGTTINFDSQKIKDCHYTAEIFRGADRIYRLEADYNTLIQSQEVLSEASFFAQVNTSVTNGSITPSQKQPQGSNITISYSPNEGYELESITVDGSAVSIASYPSSYTFYNTQGTHSINVKYKIKTFTLTSSVSNGTITPSAVVNWGTSKTFTYTPSNGYLLQSVVVDGAAVNIGSYPDSYTFSNVRANHTISVTYARPSASKGWELQP